MLNLKFTINAYDLLEKVEGKPLGKIVEGISSEQYIGTAKRLIWAGKLHEFPKMTPAEAGDLLQNELDNGKRFDEVIEEIIVAIKDSNLFHDPSDNAEAEAGAGGNPPESPAANPRLSENG